MNETKKSIFSPNKLVAVVIYVLVLFLIAGFITIGIGIIIGTVKNLDLNIVIQSFTTTDFIGFDPEYIRVSSISQGWGNFFGYLISFIAVVFFMRDDVVTDFKSLKEKKHYYAKYITIAFFAFYGAASLVEMFLAYVVKDSANQLLIEAILNNGGAVPMVLATVLLAPVVEELIYRKAIFYFGNKYSIACSYVLSILFFTLPHMISSDMSNIGMWLLQCIPYAVSGGLLCLIYHKSNYNIYTCIIVHMANNLIACILTFIG